MEKKSLFVVLIAAGNGIPDKEKTFVLMEPYTITKTQVLAELWKDQGDYRQNESSLSPVRRMVYGGNDQRIRIK